MKKIFLGAVAASLLLTSCNYDSPGLEESQSISTYQDYFDFVTAETKAKIVVQSVNTVNSQEAISVITTDIQGDQQPLDFIYDATALTFPDYFYSASAEKSYANLNTEDTRDFFGKTYDISLDSNVVLKGNDDSMKENSVHMPSIVNASFSGLDDESVVSGTAINWNIDDKNTNGMVIGFEYIPENQVDASIAENNPDRIINGISISDRGSYLVTKQDLGIFPNGAIITFYVGRAGYKIMTDNSGEFDYSIAGLTICRGDFPVHY